MRCSVAALLGACLGLALAASGCTGGPGLEPPNGAGTAGDRGQDAAPAPDISSGAVGDGGPRVPTEAFADDDGGTVQLPPPYLGDAGAEDDAGH
jgi:hypothetical protein